MKKIVAYVPAREGSERVKLKNLMPLNGKPLVTYAIEAALQVDRLAEVYINTESEKIIRAVDKYSGLLVHHRPVELAHSDVTQDTFNYEFAKNRECDYFLLINPVCPLTTQVDINGVIDFCLKGNFNSVVTVASHQIHTLYDGKPINFDIQNKLQKTQDLKPVQLITWAVCMWKREDFLASYERDGYAVFLSRPGFYEIPIQRSVKISNMNDFYLAEILLNSK